jgi:hypothetical protein
MSMLAGTIYDKDKACSAVGEYGRCECAATRLEIQPQRRRIPSGEQFSLLPAFAIILLPKCPLCLFAWLTVLGAGGLSTWTSSLWGAPLTLILIVGSLSSMAFFALRSRNIYPLLLACAGAILLYCGKNLLDVVALQIAGTALLASATTWSGLLRVRCAL